jgi:hypothetical protein
MLYGTLFLIGCAGGIELEGDGVQVQEASVRSGVDYSWARPSPAGLRAQGYTFVCRYLSYDTTGKNLSRSEADALIGAGLDIVSNWEQAADDALGGYNTGVSDAQAAAQQAAATGAPTDRPIYFSVDFDAAPSDQAAINAYFDGVASVIGRGRTGAYGGYYVIQRLFDAGKITWGWQTYAWSGGQWEPRAQLRQVQNGIAGGQEDLDQAVAVDFGQWGHGAPSTGWRQRLAVAPNSDGRLQLFWAAASNGWLYDNVQTAPGLGWAGAAQFGGAGTQLSTVENGDGRIEVFYVGTDHAIYHNWQDSPGGAWHGQAALGGAAKQLAAVANADGRLEVFYVGTNDHLFHNWQDTPGGAWHGEAELGGAAKQIEAAVNQNGATEIFYIGTNDRLYHRWYSGAGWSAEAALGGAAKQLTVTRNADGRLEIFYAGTDDGIYHNWQNAPGAAWHGEAAMGGAAKQLAVGQNADGRAELFYIGTNDALYHRWFSNGWSGEAALGGAAKQLAVTRNSDGRLELFYVGTNDGLYHNWQNSPGAAWHGQAGF